MNGTRFGLNEQRFRRNRMRRVRTIVPLVALFTAFAVLMFGRPVTAPQTFGPAPAAAASIVWAAAACSGTVKIGTANVPFVRVSDVKATVSASGGTFVGNETDLEGTGAKPFVCTASGRFGLGAGPRLMTTFVTTSK